MSRYKNKDMKMFSTIAKHYTLLGTFFFTLHDLNHYLVSFDVRLLLTRSIYVFQAWSYRTTIYIIAVTIITATWRLHHDSRPKISCTNQILKGHHNILSPPPQLPAFSDKWPRRECVSFWVKCCIDGKSWRKSTHTRQLKGNSIIDLKRYLVEE